MPILPRRKRISAPPRHWLPLPKRDVIPIPVSQPAACAVAMPSPTRSSNSGGMSRKPFGSSTMFSRCPTRSIYSAEYAARSRPSRANAEGAAAARDSLKVVVAAETTRAYAQGVRLGVSSSRLRDTRSKSLRAKRTSPRTAMRPAPIPISTWYGRKGWWRKRAPRYRPSRVCGRAALFQLTALLGTHSCQRAGDQWTRAPCRRGSPR